MTEQVPGQIPGPVAAGGGSGSGRGVWLAVDPGQVRTGVAGCDPGEVLASPVATLDRAESVTGVVALVDERGAIGVVVGLALSLSGSEGASAAAGRRLAQRLADALAVPVYLVDERLTTVGAGSALRAAGHTTRTARGVIDQAAAAALLQGLLDAAASRGTDVASQLDAGLGERVLTEGGR